LQAETSRQARQHAGPQRWSLTPATSSRITPPRGLEAAAWAGTLRRAFRFVLGEHRRGDCYIRTRVEELERRPAEARRPFQRNAEKANRWPSSVACDVLRGLEGGHGRREIISRLQGRQVAHEVDVTAALHVDHRAYESVVGVKAASENQREDIHRGFTTVRVERGTGPK
jgi:hypothetical protein